MRRAPDMTGQRFGRLLVQSRSESRHGATWLCRCDCGTRKIVAASNLRNGSTKSCGCFHDEAARKHGDTKSVEYNAWRGMISRCGKPKNPKFYMYGGRGIRVCERWASSYENFLADMGRKPSPRHSVDRIDGNGHYEPGNCRWATPRQQQANTRRNVLVRLNGEVMCTAEVDRRLGYATGKALWRLRNYGVMGLYS